MKNWIKNNKVKTFMMIYFPIFIGSAVYYSYSGVKWPMYGLIAIMLLALGIWLKAVFSKR